MKSAKLTPARLVAFACVGLMSYAIAKRKSKRPLSFAGKVVLITGGSRGLGFALAEAFAKVGAKVVIMARDKEELATAKLKLEAHKASSTSPVATVLCDVAQAADVQEAIRGIETQFGQIDLIVNSAGVIGVAPILNQSLDQFHHAMDTNLYGALHTTLAALPRMIERGSGTIVNVASIGGLVAVPHLLPYTASKFALVGLSRGMNAELASKGIKVVTVCPWLMRTGSHLHAKFGGKRNLEYGWFGLGATLPLISVPARTAARRILEAAAAGQSEIVISNWAKLVVSAAHTAPRTWAAALRLIAQLLPGDTDSVNTSQVEGGTLAGPTTILPNVLGAKAVQSFNQ